MGVVVVNGISDRLPCGYVVVLCCGGGVWGQVVGGCLLTLFSMQCIK